MKTIIDKLETLNTGLRIPIPHYSKVNCMDTHTMPSASLYQLRVVLGVNFTVSGGMSFDVAKSYATQNLKFVIYEDVLESLNKIMYAINNLDNSSALNLCSELRSSLLKA